MNNRSCFLLLVFLGLMGSCLQAAPAAKDGPLPIYDQWPGTDSMYHGSPPFLLIRDMSDFIIFWKKHTPDETMPYVDFTKTMVFLYAPGPKRFDMGPMKIARYVRENGVYLLFLNYEKRRTGGFIRGPYLIAYLPMMPMDGQMYVFRVGDDKKGEPPRIPLYEFTHLGGGPISNMAMARLQAVEPKSMPIPYVTKEPYTPEPESEPTAAPVKRPTPRPQPVSPTPKPAQPPIAITQPVVAAAAPVARPVQTASVPTPKPTSAELPVIDAATAKSVDAFGMDTKAEAKKTTSEASAKKPDLLSDPFQEQFNIEF